MIAGGRLASNCFDFIRLEVGMQKIVIHVSLNYDKNVLGNNAVKDFNFNY